MKTTTMALTGLLCLAGLSLMLPGVSADSNCNVNGPEVNVGSNYSCTAEYQYCYQGTGSGAGAGAGAGGAGGGQAQAGAQAAATSGCHNGGGTGCVNESAVNQIRGPDFNPDDYTGLAGVGAC